MMNDKKEPSLQRVIRLAEENMKKAEKEITEKLKDASREELMQIILDQHKKGMRH